MVSLLSFIFIHCETRIFQPQCVLDAQSSGDEFALKQELPDDWAKKRPEELTSGQFVEITRMLYGPKEEDVKWEENVLQDKIWRKIKHGSNEK